jgi:hypothetical protein
MTRRAYVWTVEPHWLPLYWLLNVAPFDAAAWGAVVGFFLAEGLGLVTFLRAAIDYS